MNTEDRVILLDHGSGGLASQELIAKLFLPRLENPILSELGDSAVVDTPSGRLAFSTDSYVVDPIFFPGGDIGSLAVHGTINDVAMSGAYPLCLSLGLILEEGFSMKSLSRIAESIGNASRAAGVPVVAGDTKVVPRGKADGIFINTSGLGMIPEGVRISAARVEPGDGIILSGTIADHGVTILTRRAELSVQGDMRSDTMPLHTLVKKLVDAVPAGVHAMRDPTRGGLATVLCEVAGTARAAIEVDETAIGIRPGVQSACELLGLDPLYMANEGRCVVFVDARQLEAALDLMRSTEEGRESAIVGRVLDGPPGRVTLRTDIGGTRILRPLCGEPLPRIC